MVRMQFFYFLPVCCARIDHVYLDVFCHAILDIGKLLQMKSSISLENEIKYISAIHIPQFCKIELLSLVDGCVCVYVCM